MQKLYIASKYVKLETNLNQLFAIEKKQEIVMY